jgi:hypothetical protein
MSAAIKKKALAKKMAQHKQAYVDTTKTDPEFLRAQRMSATIEGGTAKGKIAAAMTAAAKGDSEYSSSGEGSPNG